MAIERYLEPHEGGRLIQSLNPSPPAVCSGRPKSGRGNILSKT